MYASPAPVRNANPTAVNGACRPTKLIVAEYLPAAAVDSQAAATAGEMLHADPEQNKAFLKFLRYLAGFRGNKARAEPKVAVVKTRTYELYLEADAEIGRGERLLFKIKV